MSTIKDKVLLAPEVTDEPAGYIDTLIEQAQAVILEYTRIGDEWPEGDTRLDAACVRLVLHLYRQGGTEHAGTVSVGDVSVTAYDLPPVVLAMIKPRRRIAIAATEYEEDNGT